MSDSVDDSRCSRDNGGDARRTELTTSAHTEIPGPGQSAAHLSGRRLVLLLEVLRKADRGLGVLDELTRPAERTDSEARMLRARANDEARRGNDRRATRPRARSNRWTVR